MKRRGAVRSADGRAAEAFEAVGEAKRGAHAARHEAEILLNAGEAERRARKLKA
jgi:hypothetical protein